MEFIRGYMKAQLNKILALIYLTSIILISFIPNTMEAFMHFDLLIFNIIQIISFTSFLWIILGLLYESKMAKLNAFYIALPFTLLRLIFLNNYISLYNFDIYYSVIFYINLIIEIILSIYLFITLDNKKYHLKYLLYQLIITILFIPQNIFTPLALRLSKYNYFNFTNFSIWHILFLLLFIISAITLFLYLKNKNRRQIKLILFSLSLIILFNILTRFSYTKLYDYQETRGIYGAIPLYICSFGSIILPLAIYIDNRKLSSTLFLINCPGAIIVLVNPTTGITDIFNYNVLHFFYIHILLFVITLMLPIYLDAKPTKYSLIYAGFSLIIYFTIISLINAGVYYFTNYDANFSFVTTSPIDVGIEKYLQFKMFGLSYSILYLFILWLVQYILAICTYMIYKLVNKIKINKEILL